jgi:DNA-binding CsgD family transcriptional regulator
MTDRQITELSERELEILRLVATGASNKEIGQQLFISANTVKVHLRNIFAKIGAASRTEAAMYCVRHGLVESDQQLPQEDGEPGGSSLEDAYPEVSGLPVSEQLVASRLRSRPVLVGVSLLALVLTGLMVIFFNNSASQGVTPTQANIPTGIPSATRWMTLAGLSEPRHSLAVAAVDNHIFAIGGEGEEGVSGLVEMYTVETDRWETKLPKPIPVSEAGAVVIGGLIYVPGGRTASGLPTHILEVYDPREDRWETRAGMPKALSGSALVGYEGRLYVFGGWDGERFVDDVFEYDPRGDTWGESAPMPTARGYAGAAVVNRKIFILGGFDGNSPLSVNEQYSPDVDLNGENPWIAGPPLPEPRYGLAATSIADIIQIIGGVGAGEGPMDWLEYVPSLDTWGKLEPPMAESWSHLGVVPLYTRIYMVGGLSEGVPLDRTMAYQAIYTVSLPIIR